MVMSGSLKITFMSVCCMFAEKRKSERCLENIFMNKDRKGKKNILNEHIEKE